MHGLFNQPFTATLKGLSFLWAVSYTVHYWVNIHAQSGLWTVPHKLRRRLPDIFHESITAAMVIRLVMPIASVPHGLPFYMAFDGECGVGGGVVVDWSVAAAIGGLEGWWHEFSSGGW